MKCVYKKKNHLKIFLNERKVPCCSCCRSKKRGKIDVHPHDEDASNAVLHQRQDECDEAKLNDFKPIDEVRIGDFDKRNRTGLQPFELEHQQPIIVTKDMIKHEDFVDIRKLLTDQLEADYLICTRDENENDHRYKVIMSQLEDLELVRNRDYFVFVVEDGEPGCLKSCLSCCSTRDSTK